MILSDVKIMEGINNREIVIEPFDPECLGTNSYDVHLGKSLAIYKDHVLDAKKHNGNIGQWSKYIESKSYLIDRK